MSPPAPWAAGRSTASGRRASLPPAQYLSSSYYEIWLAGLHRILVEKGFVTPEELEQGKPLAPAKTPKRVLKGDEVAGVLRRGFPYEREAEAPARFAVGDAVRTRVMHPQHHTRLPGSCCQFAVECGQRQAFPQGQLKIGSVIARQPMFPRK